MVGAFFVERDDSYGNQSGTVIRFYTIESCAGAMPGKGGT